MPDIKNGLLQMESRPRRVPPPKHPKLAVETPPPPAPVPVRSETPAVVRTEPSLTVVQEPLRAPKQPPLRGAQVYLDEPADGFLKACRAAGEVSNSAVVRLALQELSNLMTPTEVARALLLGDNAARRIPGRKARH